MRCSQKTKQGMPCFCKVMRIGDNKDLCRVHYLQQENKNMNESLSIYKCCCIVENGTPCMFNKKKGIDRCHQHRNYFNHVCWFQNSLGIQCGELIDTKQKYCEKHKYQEIDID